MTWATDSIGAPYIDIIAKWFILLPLNNNAIIAYLYILRIESTESCSTQNATI